MANPLAQLTLDQLRQRTSVKWRRFPDDVLPLWVAEMDVPLADPVREELVRAAEAGDTGYDPGTGYPQAAAEFAVRRWGWEFDVANSATVPDVMQGIVEVLTLVTDPGDPVVINSPVYTPFYEFVEKAGRRPVESPLGEDHRIDLAGLEETFAGLRGDGGRAAYLLCSPHNPTGTVHTRAELEAVVRLAGEHGVRVVADEIHAPIVYRGAEFVPVLTVPGAENAFSLVSASKAWNLAGIKSALAIAGPDAAEDLKRMPEVVGHGASHLGVLAHTAALRHGEPWLDELLVGLDENRRLLGDLLAEHLPDVRYEPPAGTYLAWLDCRALALDADPADVFLDKGRVALVPGPVFGTGGAGHVRLNLGTTPEILEEAVRRMASAL